MMANSWQTVTLREVMRIDIDAVPVYELPEFPISGVYSFARGLFARESLPNTQTTYKFFHRLHKDMFVISTPKAWEGALARVTDEFDGWFLSPVFPTFRANPAKLDIKYFEWFCRQAPVWAELQRKSRGIGARRESVSAQQFLTLEIPLPPLVEQRRIVARIEALAERVAAAQALRRDSDFETDLFINSFLNSLIDDAQKKYKLFFLEDLLIEANYGTSVKCQPERVGDATPVLRIPNVSSEKVTLTDMKYGVLSGPELQKTMLNEGDILIVRTNGSADLVGRCAVVPTLPEAMAFASYMIRIRCDKKIVLPEFLQLVMRQQRTGGFLIDFARTTAGQYNVSLGRLRKTKIPIPPIEEQRRLVKYLNGLQARVTELRTAQAKTERELAALMPSVLDRAFKGEL